MAEVHHWIRALFQIVIGMFPVENYSAFQAKSKMKQKTQPGDSSRNLFIPWFGGHQPPLFSGHVFTHHPF